MWTEFDNTAQNYRLNFKLGHVNANSIGGFKFYEIRTWLLSGRFDILVISETKIDGSFPDSQFQVEGFRLCRSDRKAGGGGLMIYVRSDIHFVKVKYLKGITPEEWAAFRTETIILKFKLGRVYKTYTTGQLRIKTVFQNNNIQDSFHAFLFIFLF